MAEVSVVIPAYNAAKTIERTVRSVMASTIPLDVWIVDDGSVDDTSKILEGLRTKVEKRGGERNPATLHVLRQPNGGCYQARLAALKQIQTPYFGFADADDTVEPDMFEKMLEFAKTRNLDAVRCGYDGAVDLGAGEQDRFVAETREAVFETYVRPALIEGVRGGTYVWNMLYRNQYDFAAFDPTDHDTNFEDMIFNLQFFLRVGRMGFLNEPLYHYATTEGSAVHSFGENKLKDFREVCRIRRELLPRYGVAADGAENRAWFRANRLNCLKSTIGASNLRLAQKLSLARRLLQMRVSPVRGVFTGRPRI